MGMLDLMRLMSIQRQRDQERRRRRQAQAPRDGSIALRAKRKGSPCQQDGDSQGAADIEIPSLSEDILRLIHSFMPMRDAARAACVSHSFLSSWRCHPNLNFSNETLGLNKNACGKEELAGLFYSKVDHILKRHSGIGVKKLKIQYQAKYNFPCSLLSNGSGDSIQYLHLSNCSFHPTVTLGGLRSLTRLHLCLVRITENELGDKTQLQLGETLQIKSLCMVRSGYVYHARAELPSIMPNLESLAIQSCKETAFAPKLCSKFLCLRHLSIALIGFFPAYDYLSLASYIYAAPSLETFDLNVMQRYVQNVSIFAHPADLRSMREEQHHSLKSTGFRCTTPGSKIGKCPPLDRDIFMEGHRGVLAIRRYIQPRVPSTVKLTVLEPCSCHSTEL
uniref:F-box domain-containing protein n=1 Tax=Oryza punctata TaxID=4537 RepID=A0A0E0L7L3_ORYPU